MNSPRSVLSGLPVGALLVALSLASCAPASDPAPAGGNDPGTLTDPTTTTLISSTYPASGAVDIAVNSYIYIDFKLGAPLPLTTTLTASSIYLKDGTGALVPLTFMPPTAAQATTIWMYPATALKKGKTYTATMTTAVKTAGGLSLAADYSWSFTTVQPPALSTYSNSFTPSDGATRIPIDAPGIEADLNLSLDPATLDSSTFTVKDPKGISVPGSCSLSPTSSYKALFTPTQALEPYTTYTATLTRGIKSAEGGTLPAEVSWSFTTEPRAFFGAAVPMIVGWPTSALASFDVDKNGFRDLVALTSYCYDSARPPSLFVWLRDSTGLAAAPITRKLILGSSDSPASLAFGDLDADATIEIAVSESDGIEVLSLSGSSLVSESKLTTGDNFDILVADLDGDGREDLAGISHLDIGHISIWYQGTGGLASTPALLSPRLGTGNNHLLAGDLTGDGLPDLVAMSGGNTSLPDFSLFARTTVGYASPLEFDVFGPLPNTYVAQGMAIGDLDGDGKLDLAVSHADWGSSRYSTGLFHQAGGALSATETGFPALRDPYATLIRDFDGDSRADIAVYHSGSRYEVGVFRQLSDGSFVPEAESPVPDCRSTWNCQVMVCDDFNGDGKLDLAVGSGASAIDFLYGL